MSETRIGDSDPEIDTSVFSCRNSIELHWPTKGHMPKIVEGSLTVELPSEFSTIAPLLSQDLDFKVNDEPRVQFISGARLSALRTLSKHYGGDVKLAYFDTPRIESMKVLSPEKVNSIWMSVVREWAQGCRSLLSKDGVFVLHTDDRTPHYGRIVLEEVFGPTNYVATFVWEKKYGPQADRDMPTASQDYLIVFANDLNSLPPVCEPNVKVQVIDDGDPRGPWSGANKGARNGNDATNFTFYTPPYRWELTAGKWPPGLWRISPFSGVIWGTPTVSGKYDFEVTVCDSDGNTSTAELCISVDAEGVSCSETDVWWMNKLSQSSNSPLSIQVTDLPNGVVGKEYSAVLVAGGGTPFSEEKRQGEGRYWEFSRETLVSKVLEDDVNFGVQGNANPALKNHHEGPRFKKVLTWWSKDLAGKSEDATKHLKELKEAGLIADAPRIAKPEKMLKRVLDHFSKPGDTVLALEDPTASLVGAAVKLRRNVIALVGETELEKEYFRDCAYPRIKAVLQGLDQSNFGITNYDDVEWKGGGQLTGLEVGADFLVSNVAVGTIEVNTADYPLESDKFLAAVCSVAGFERLQNEPVDGVDGKGRACIIIRPGICLTDFELARIVSEVLPKFNGVNVLFESSYLSDIGDLPAGIRLIRYPFELVY